MQGIRYGRVIAATAAAVLTAVLGAGTAAAASRIAFSQPPSSDEPGASSIFTMNPDGSNLRRVSHGGFDQNPSWSPSRHRLAYTWSIDLTGAIRIVNADGSHQHKIPNTDTGSDPDWSPNGRLIAFARCCVDTDRPGRAIFTIRPNGKSLHRLTSYSGVSGPAWSHDGKMIAYAHHHDIWVMRANGTHHRKLIGDGAAPNWSPDDQRITFQRGGNVYVALANGENVRRITGGQRAGQYPAWSPDGADIAFQGHGGGIWRMDGEGLHAVQLTQEGLDPDW